MYTLRTRFKKEIVTEFLVPKRASSKAIIFCGGMPSMPSQKSLLEFFVKKGYWVFFPRYRGSWESGGRFLRRSPDEDISDIISELHKGFRSIGDDRMYQLRPKHIYLFASSFGGAAALLASRDSRVTRVVTFSPVVDWRAESKAEPLGWLRNFVRDAFGEGYRFRDQEWNKLRGGKFFNPWAHKNEIDGGKLLIIHAKDDEIVPFRSVQKFAKATSCKLLLQKKGGHFSLSSFMKPRFYRLIQKFLKKHK